VAVLQLFAASLDDDDAALLRGLLADTGQRRGS
jgi:hypothetical protein